MPQHRSGLAVACASVLAVMLTACSSNSSGAPPTPIPTATHFTSSTWSPDDGNGLILLDVATARDVVISAMRAQDSLVMHGTARGIDGTVYALKVLSSADLTWASFTVDGQVTHVVLDGSRALVSPSAAVARADQLRPGVYSCVATDSPSVTRWGYLLDPISTVAELSADITAIGAPHDGRLDFVLGADGSSGQIAVATDGAPLPLSLVRADDSGQVALTFDGWNSQVPRPPESADPQNCAS